MNKRKTDTESTSAAFERAVRFLICEGCRRQDRRDDKAYQHLVDGRTRERQALDKRRDKAEEELAILEFLSGLDMEHHSELVQMFIRAAAGWKGAD